MLIEEAYQMYVNICFGEPLSETQDTELRRAFFAGIGWMKEALTAIKNEELVINLFIIVSKELDEFVGNVKSTIN